jgi:CheY-like chemotaxis protein
MTTNAKRPAAIVLLAEDDVGDQILTREAFETLQVPHELHIVGDGKEALDYLYGRGAYVSLQGAPRPDLILLDLNMPRVSGQQVAVQIHSDPQLQDIPIVVLTTSRRQEDILRSYGRGVTCFITKPLEFEHFMEAVRDLESLLKFLVAYKSLRQRTRLTDRQVLRLMRRQRQFERLTETLFQHHINQIRTILRRGPDEAAASPLSLGDRAAVVRLVQKILDGVSPDRAASHDPMEAPSGLSNLARALNSTSTGTLEAVCPAAPQPPKKGPGDREAW